MRKTIITATVLLGLLGAATACTTTEPKPAVTVTATTPETNTDTGTGEPAGITKRDLTDTATDMTWNQASEKSKTDMCAGLDLYGVKWAEEQLRTGGGTDAKLDWHYMAGLIADKCALR